MRRGPEETSLTTEEVAFWRGFIEWWVSAENKPVPVRAWMAPRRAEEKRHLADDEVRVRRTK